MHARHKRTALAVAGALAGTTPVGSVLTIGKPDGPLEDGSGASIVGAVWIEFDPKHPAESNVTWKG